MKGKGILRFVEGFLWVIEPISMDDLKSNIEFNWKSIRIHKSNNTEQFYNGQVVDFHVFPMSEEEKKELPVSKLDLVEYWAYVDGSSLKITSMHKLRNYIYNSMCVVNSTFENLQQTTELRMVNSVLEMLLHDIDETYLKLNKDEILDAVREGNSNEPFDLIPANWFYENYIQPNDLPYNDSTYKMH